MSFTQVQSLLSSLELKGALAQFNMYVDNPSEFEKTSTVNILIDMLIHETNERNKRKQENLIKVSRLPVYAEISSILKDGDRSDAEFIKKFDSLSSLDFIEKGYNLTIFGKPGAGKTFIASALGRKNCQIGRSTLYYPTKDLIDLLSISRGSLGYSSKIKTICGKSLLILDDFCLTTYTTEEKSILFDVLDKRYGKKSTMFLSQKSPDAWLSILSDGVNADSLAESIVERCATNNYTLIVPGESRRRSFD